jgi:hypothetical protein
MDFAEVSNCALAGMVMPVEDVGMNPPRFFLLVVAGCGLLRSEPLFADDVASLYGPGKQYTADMVSNLPDGGTSTVKIYTDNGKVRTETHELGFDGATIYRLDLKKVYLVIPSRKMVMEHPYNETTKEELLPVGTAVDYPWELVGPETADGVACTKYKLTTEEKRVFFIWIDSSKNIPVEFYAADGSYSMLWKNRKAGPQDASLFEVPAGYQVVPIPGMPSGGGGGQ